MGWALSDWSLAIDFGQRLGKDNSLLVKHWRDWPFSSKNAILKSSVTFAVCWVDLDDEPLAGEEGGEVGEEGGGGAGGFGTTCPVCAITFSSPDKLSIHTEEHYSRWVLQKL